MGRAPAAPRDPRPRAAAGRGPLRRGRGDFRPISLRRLVQPFLGRGRALLAATLLPAVLDLDRQRLAAADATGPAAQILLEQDEVQLGKIADVMKAPVLPDSATVSNEIAILLSTPILEGAARRLGMLDADGAPVGPAAALGRAGPHLPRLGMRARVPSASRPARAPGRSAPRPSASSARRG